MTLPYWYVVHAVQHYESWGTFPDGSTFNNLDEDLWNQMRVVQRLLAYEKWKVDHPDDWPFDDEAATAEPEPPPMTLEMM